MTTPAEDAKDLLVAASVGVFNATTGWAIGINKETDAPDTRITLYDSGGLTPSPRYLLDYPSLQVRVRGSASDPNAARTKIKEVKDALLGLESQDVNGNRWVSVLGQGDVTPLGFDKNDRPLFVINFSLIIEPALTGTENRIPL